MSAGRRNDATVATRPEWMPIVEQAKAHCSVRGLPKPPPGVEYHPGQYYTRTVTKRNDGTARVTLTYYWPGRCLMIGAWTETRKPRSTCQADHADTYPVGKQITLACGRVVQVVLVGGLPYPVPVPP